MKEINYKVSLDKNDFALLNEFLTFLILIENISGKSKKK
jgi:hypothetical protein